MMSDEQKKQIREAVDNLQNVRAVIYDHDLLGRNGADVDQSKINDAWDELQRLEKAVKEITDV